MGFLILLCSGAVLGWLVALITGAQDSRAAWLRVIVGAFATLVSGLVVSERPLVEALGAHTLIVAIGIGCTVLALVSALEPLLRRTIR